MHGPLNVKFQNSFHCGLSLKNSSISNYDYMKRDQVCRIRIPSISVNYLKYQRTYLKMCVLPWRIRWNYVVIPFYSTPFSSPVSKITYFLSLLSQCMCQKYETSNSAPLNIGLLMKLLSGLR